MDIKRKNVPLNTISRDMVQLSEDTGNVYETVMVIAKRANQISQELKQELHSKLEEFQTIGAEETVPANEDTEQMELSRQYERMPKATLIAAKEYEDGELYHNVAGRIKK
ncbi:MAG: DNA-directed RNA polymerase subunit omega [Porphyromonas sp.]|nr:DNA-directed RNA polymerase subunit omega [Porphyromonas sp.]